jgi:hypothetical protein
MSEAKIPTTTEINDGWRARDAVEVGMLVGEPVGSSDGGEEGASEVGQSRGEKEAERSLGGFSSPS